MAYKKRQRRRRRRQAVAAAVMIVFVLLIGAGAAGGFYLWDQSRDYIGAYEKSTYNKALYQGGLFAQDLCVTSGEVSLDGFQPDSSLHAAGLFNLGEEQVVCGYRLFDQLYPASTTKTMTAYLALKYGNPDDLVTVSAHATDFNWDESVAGLVTGDSLTLYDLICGLMLCSGNDCGTAIAEHISGTHFVNPHGLHDDDHYTTAYDLYLIFNAACKDQRFMDIISMSSYTAEITGADGTVRTASWAPTNYYSAGLAAPPEGVRVIGGKTGTTDQAGNCVILYDENTGGTPYISVIMGASDKTLLYDQMNQLFSAGMTGV